MANQEARMGRSSSCDKHITLAADQVPLIFREAHVHAGFRPVGRPVSYYVSGLTTLDNETMNVWTHLIAACVMGTELSQICREGDYARNRLTLPYVIFLLSCVTYLLTSSLAHLLHVVSPKAHYLAFYLDFVGIALYCFCSAAVFGLYSSTDRWYAQNGAAYLPVTFALSTIVSLSCIFAKYNFTRPYPPIKKYFIIMPIGISYLWNIWPIVDRLLDPSSANNSLHYAHIGAFLLAVWFYSSGFPQSRFPGKCDIFFHGHQIFHVFISITTWCQTQALRDDVSLATRERERCVEFVSYLCLLIVLSATFVLYFYAKICQYLAKTPDKDL